MERKKLIRFFFIFEAEGENKLNKEGFSLIELLIALAILAFGLLATATMQVTSVRSNFFSHSLMQGSMVAQDRLEFLGNLAYDSPSLQAGSHNDQTATISGIVFNRLYTVADNTGGYKIINYTVAWNDGSDHNIAVSTVRSQ
ncbi:MAG: type IV pilus modification PilV family protein [Syntrophales bacterium]